MSVYPYPYIDLDLHTTEQLFIIKYSVPHGRDNNM